ncbi:MAG: RNA polymerase sigma factor [Prosthecobacter sp.]
MSSDAGERKNGMAEAPSQKGDGRFPSTEWTLVARLRHRDPAECKKALDELCAQYHFPLYCFIRQRGLAHHDAQDALHDFLAKLLRLDSLADLEQEKGRLRTFLSKALDRFLITRHHRERRRGAHEVSLEDDAGFAFDPRMEQRFEREMKSAAATPDVLFDRQWCGQLMKVVLRRLKVRYHEKQKAALYEVLSPVLASGGSLRGHDAPALAARLAMTEGAMRSALMRMLRDYRALIVEEVRQTVGSKEAVEAEIADLMRALVTSG